MHKVEDIERAYEVFCPFCGKHAVWCENSEIYGKRYGHSYMCYLCKPCDAYVGCHNNTRRPLGTMANKELREARKAAHAAFDPIWKSGKRSRAQAYDMLNKHFGRSVHIGESDKETCDLIIKFVQQYA